MLFTFITFLLVLSAAVPSSAKNSIALSLSPSSVSENASATTITVTATAKYAFADISAEIRVEVGTSGDSATEGTDYSTVADFTITLPQGNKVATGTFSLSPIQDSVDETNETVTVSGSSSHASVTSTLLSITDDDDPSLSVGDVSVAESVTGGERNGDGESQPGAARGGDG